MDEPAAAADFLSGVYGWRELLRAPAFPFAERLATGGARGLLFVLGARLPWRLRGHGRDLGNHELSGGEPPGARQAPALHGQVWSARADRRSIGGGPQEQPALDLGARGLWAARAAGARGLALRAALGGESGAAFVASGARRCPRGSSCPT